MKKPSLKTRVALELLGLGTLAALFLVLFSQRALLVDITLAFCALALLALNAGFTGNVIWGQFPVETSGRDRLRRRVIRVMTPTLALAFALLGAGIALGYWENGCPAALRRVSNWHILIAIGLYFPWALVQQTLFQFYLLGRLRTLFPAWGAVLSAGALYALVHLPDPEVTIAALAPGIFWTRMYYVYRLLSPLALSHAILGSAFYYWVSDRDLAAEWLPFVAS